MTTTAEEREAKAQEEAASRLDAAVAALNLFLEAWRDARWDDAAKFTTWTWRSKQHAPGEALAGRYGLLKLGREYEIKTKVATAVAIDAQVYTTMTVLGEEVPVQIVLRLVCEKGSYDPSVRGDWGVAVDSISPYREWTKETAKAERLRREARDDGTDLPG